MARPIPRSNSNRTSETSLSDHRKENPLGIFYRNGSIQVSDNVTIQGTLVATGTVTITGENARLCAYNWKGDGGRALVPNAELWPRLPAVVANAISTSRNLRTAIEGAVFVEQTLSGAGGNFEYFDTNDVDITGTATSTPGQQPWSTVEVNEVVNLAQFDDSGQYEIWLQDGSSGSWFTIVGIDAAKPGTDGARRSEARNPRRVSHSDAADFASSTFAARSAARRSTSIVPNRGERLRPRTGVNCCPTGNLMSTTARRSHL